MNVYLIDKSPSMWRHAAMIGGAILGGLVIASLLRLAIFQSVHLEVFVCFMAILFGVLVVVNFVTTSRLQQIETHPLSPQALTEWITFGQKCPVPPATARKAVTLYLEAVKNNAKQEDAATNAVQGTIGEARHERPSAIN